MASDIHSQSFIMVTRDTLVEKLKQMLPTLDIESTTQRSIQDRLEEELGCSMIGFKDLIKTTVDEYLLSTLQDDDEDDFEPETKRQKSSVENMNSPQGLVYSVALSSKRFAGVKSYKGKQLLDIREFYEKDGVLAPGAKGISLTSAQWEILVRKMDEIRGALDVPVETFEESTWNISPLRRLTTRVYAGKKMVDIREFYESDGTVKPGKKGISLTMDQWEYLCKNKGELSEYMKSYGGSDVKVEAREGLTSGDPATGNVATPAVQTNTVAKPSGNVQTKYDLSKNKFVSLESWKGNDMLDIREYYQSDGVLKPGKKGISLPPVQAKVLLSNLEDIEKAYAEKNLEYEVQLSAKRKVKISEYKGFVMVDIREYYEKDSKWMPGSKGISLQHEQWSKLIEALPKLVAVMQ